MDTRPAALSPGQAAALLEAAISAIRAEVAGVPDALSRWRPAPGEWCINEVLGHLIEADRRGFAGRIHLILGADTPTLEGWDQDAVAAARRDHERPTAALLEELGRMRAEAIPMVRALGVAELGRAGIHPTVGWLAVADLLHEWVHHDRNHIRQILANVQAAAWPYMGNAQRFSAR